jgi:hypothetical protein
VVTPSNSPVVGIPVDSIQQRVSQTAWLRLLALDADLAAAEPEDAAVSDAARPHAEPSAAAAATSSQNDATVSSGKFLRSEFIGRKLVLTRPD